MGRRSPCHPSRRPSRSARSVQARAASGLRPQESFRSPRSRGHNRRWYSQAGGRGLPAPPSDLRTPRCLGQGLHLPPTTTTRLCPATLSGLAQLMKMLEYDDIIVESLREWPFRMLCQRALVRCLLALSSAIEPNSTGRWWTAMARVIPGGPGFDWLKRFPNRSMHGSPASLSQSVLFIRSYEIYE